MKRFLALELLFYSGQWPRYRLDLGRCLLALLLSLARSAFIVDRCTCVDRKASIAECRQRIARRKALLNVGVVPAACVKGGTALPKNTKSGGSTKTT